MGVNPAVCPNDKWEKVYNRKDFSKIQKMIAKIAQKAQNDKVNVQGTNNSEAYKFCKDLSDIGYLDKIFDRISQHKKWDSYCLEGDMYVTFYENKALELTFVYDYNDHSWGVIRTNSGFPDMIK